MNAHPSISAEQHFLSEALEPIRQFLDDPAVVEISCQRSNEIWLERIGQLSMVRQQIDGVARGVVHEADHQCGESAAFGNAHQR
jgi:type IV secretion system protein VirB11